MMNKTNRMIRRNNENEFEMSKMRFDDRIWMIITGKVIMKTVLYQTYRNHLICALLFNVLGRTSFLTLESSLFNSSPLIWKRSVWIRRWLDPWIESTEWIWNEGIEERFQCSYGIRNITINRLALIEFFHQYLYILSLSS